MSRKKAKKKVAPDPGSYVFVSFAPGGVPRSVLAKAGWVVMHLLAPRFHKITIENGEITDNYYCHASRGTFRRTPDRVSWVNRDGAKRVIRFLNNRTPLANGALTIELGPYEGSAWYELSPTSGSTGQAVPYQYRVDERLPGPDGPSVISED